MDGISMVTSAEESAAKKRVQAREDAERILSDARQRAKDASARAGQEARAESDRLLDAARKSAQAQSDAILENAKIECASIERSAAAHMREAANHIAERIVGN